MAPKKRTEERIGTGYRDEEHEPGIKPRPDAPPTDEEALLDEQDDEDFEEPLEGEPEEDFEDEEEGEEEEDPEATDVSTLRQTIEELQKERDGYRRDMFRLRERNRVVRAQRQYQQLYEPPTEPSAGEQAAQDRRVKIEVGDDGELSFDPSQLAPPTPQPQRGLNPQQMPPAAAQAMQYQRIRAQLLDESEDPVEAADALDELEVAYGYLDRMVGQSAMELGVAPQGEQGLVEMIETEGIDRRFARRFPNVNWKRLIHAPNSPYILRELVQSQLDKRVEKQDVRRTEESRRRENVLRSGDRPRSMRRGRRRAKPRPTAKTLEELSPEELLRLSDEEVEEYERILSR